MAEWFKDWFNTKYYHILYKDRDFTEAESFLENLLSKLSLPSDSHLLDLACGKGRHSVFLSKMGYKVLGVDLSPKNISYAKEFENEKLKFEVHDMREPIIDKKFDAVFNLFTSFGYFDDRSDNAKVIRSLHQSLKPQGVFIIDFMNVDFVLEHYIKDYFKQEEGIDFHLKKKVEDGFIIKDITFEDEGRQFHFEEKVQILRLADFEEMLSQESFKIDQVFGDYKLATFDPQNSERLIIKASAK